MPIVIPTAEELQRMDARSKAKWQRTLGRIFSQLNEAWHESDEGGEVRRQAYLWFQMYGTDQQAEQHREQLREALS